MLERHVRELLLDVLGVVCGVVGSVGPLNMVVPPTALLNLKRLDVPAYLGTQIIRIHNNKKLDPKIYECFLQFLNPLNPEKQPKTFNAIPHKSCEFSATGNDLSTLPQHEWFGKYVRARLELDGIESHLSST
jgi:hypothetical protein